jgi:hypothetical protein
MLPVEYSQLQISNGETSQIQEPYLDEDKSLNPLDVGMIVDHSQQGFTWSKTKDECWDTILDKLKKPRRNLNKSF